MPRAPHIVNISGGKDSTATYLLAIERGRPFRAVFADTGHEHPITYEFVRRLPDASGGPEIEWVRADFSRQMEGKRAFVAAKWLGAGVPADRVARAMDIIQPTGIPFLDLCIWKGRFPSTKIRFCTEELKHRPIHEQVILPALREHGAMIQWTGERAEESPKRAALPIMQTVRWADPAGSVRYWRPILRWTWQDVFALHDRHGVKPNPLYSAGMKRVGCFPCIMAGKGELAAIAARFPEAFEKLVEWEALVADAAKRGAATFFGPDKTPEGAALASAGVEGATYPRADAVADWARTSHGGRQYDLMAEIDATASCTSQYGLCE